MSDGQPTDPTDLIGDDADASTVLAKLSRGGAKGLSTTVSVIRRTIELTCIAAGITGVVAVLLGVWAWRGALAGAATATIAGATTTAVALYVLVRTRSLADAVRHPAEALAQAQDLVLRAKGSPALRHLARDVRARSAGKAAGLGRIRRAVGTGKLVSSVIGLASPDPERHRYLIPFAPDRLRHLWLGILVGLWAWLVSAVIASLALLALAFGAL